MIFWLFQRLQSQIIFVFQKKMYSYIGNCILEQYRGRQPTKLENETRIKKRNRKLKCNVQFVPFNRIHESQTIIQMSNQIRFNSLHPKIYFCASAQFAVCGNFSDCLVTFLLLFFDEIFWLAFLAANGFSCFLFRLFSRSFSPISLRSATPTKTIYCSSNFRLFFHLYSNGFDLTD